MIKTYRIANYVDFKNALLDKYGSGVTIYYNTDSIIFKIPSISNYVFRIYYYSLYGQYGTAWVTGNAVENAINYGGSTHAANAGSNWILILSDNFLIISKSANSRVHIIGKLTNGDSICMGLYYSSAYRTGSLGFNLTTSAYIYPIGFNGSMLSVSGEIYKMPLFFSTVLNSALVNLDGTLAYIDGLYCSSYQAGSDQTLTNDYWISSSEWHMESRVNALSNSLVVPLN